MDWFIAYDKEEYYLVIYQYSNEGYYGNTILKIPIETILKKYNEKIKMLTLEC